MVTSALQIVTWIIVGVIAGTLATSLFTLSKGGMGRWVNVLVGLAGAVVGGFLFNLLNITIGQDVAITLRDLLAAFIGAVIVLAVYFFLRHRQRVA